jgi:hypothetical protein
MDDEIEGFEIELASGSFGNPGGDHSGLVKRAGVDLGRLGHKLNDLAVLRAA